VLSKIDYGLPFFGWCAATHIMKIQSHPISKRKRAPRGKTLTVYRRIQNIGINLIRGCRRFIFTPINCKDIHNLIYNHLETKKCWNGIVSTIGTGVLFPAATGRPQCITFNRLRIGHTKQTHEHLLKGQKNPICSLCGGLQTSNVRLYPMGVAKHKVPKNRSWIGYQ